MPHRAAVALALVLSAVPAAARTLFDDYEEHRRSGEKAFAKGRYEEALVHFGRARDVAPCDEAYVNLLRTLHNQKRLDRILETAEEAITTRQERLDALVDRGLYMFQARDLHAEILGHAIFAVWVCDSRAARVAPEGATPEDAEILERCGGEARTRALSSMLCRDVDEHILARVEEYLAERLDSGFHDPMVYRAARGVCRRRGDDARAALYVTLEKADAAVAALEREHGPTPFMPKPRDLRKSVPKWLAIAGVYESSGFPEKAERMRRLAADYEELAASADTPAARAAEVARRRALHASARSEFGPREAPPGIAQAPLLPEPRAKRATGAARSDVEARWTHRFDTGTEARAQTVAAGPVTLGFDAILEGGRLRLRVTRFESSDPVVSALRMEHDAVSVDTIVIGPADVGSDVPVGDLRGTEVEIRFTPATDDAGGEPRP